MNYKIPTGYLIVKDYARGKLETLSIGDYGKAKNIKADFLGFHKEINGVPNGECMPLSEKWVITVSTQYGCVEKCNFCDVPNIKFGGNVFSDDLYHQFINALRVFPNVNYTDRLNLHFARMGEPSYNEAVLDFTRRLFVHKKKIQDDLEIRIETLHPVFTTMMPKKNRKLVGVLNEWDYLKNITYNGQAGLQISINSTDDEQRHEMFQGGALSLEEVSEILKRLRDPTGRKYCLNFALSSDYIVDARRLRNLFDPEKFMCKITPIHNNAACEKNNIKTNGGYNSFAPYKETEEWLKEEGFDVIVFVPSFDEEDGLVTCGNAILGGSKFKHTPATMNKEDK